MNIMKSQKGFILIDSLFAAVVTTVALISLIVLSTMGVRAYGVNNEQTRAYQIATSYGAGLQSLPIATWASLVTANTYQKIDISDSNPVVYNCLTDARSNLAKLPGATVTVSGRISPAANSGSRLAQVKIVIAWNNSAKQVSLIKYYIRNITP